LIVAPASEGRRLYPDEEPHLAGAEALVERYLAAFVTLRVRARVTQAFLKAWNAAG
jgi:hypothetical protein